MKSLRRTILLGGLAVLAFSGIATASASAAFHKEWALESGKLPQAITGVNDPTKPKMIWTTENLPTVTCETGALTGTLEAGGASKNTVSYSKCTSSDPNCNMRTPLVLNRNGQLIEVEGKLEEQYTGSGPEELMGIQQFESVTGKTCSYAGRYKIHGREQCQFSEIGVFELTHIVECLPGVKGDTLQWGEKRMTFEVSESISTSGTRYKAD